MTSLRTVFALAALLLVPSMGLAAPTVVSDQRLALPVADSLVRINKGVVNKAKSTPGTTYFTTATGEMVLSEVKDNTVRLRVIKN